MNGSNYCRHRCHQRWTCLKLSMLMVPCTRHASVHVTRQPSRAVHKTGRRNLTVNVIRTKTYSAGYSAEQPGCGTCLCGWRHEGVVCRSHAVVFLQDCAVVWIKLVRELVQCFTIGNGPVATRHRTRTGRYVMVTAGQSSFASIQRFCSTYAGAGCPVSGERQHCVLLPYVRMLAVGGRICLVLVEGMEWLATPPRMWGR